VVLWCWNTVDVLPFIVLVFKKKFVSKLSQYYGGERLAVFYSFMAVKHWQYFTVLWQWNTVGFSQFYGSGTLSVFDSFMAVKDFEYFTVLCLWKTGSISQFYGSETLAVFHSFMSVAYWWFCCRSAASVSVVQVVDRQLQDLTKIPSGLMTSLSVLRVAASWTKVTR